MVDHDKTMWQNALSSTDVNLWVLRNHLTGNVIRASTQLGDLLYSGSHSTQVAKTLASSTFFVEWLLIVSLIPWMSVLFESLWMKKRNENLRARFLFLDAILMRTNRQWWLGKKLSCRGEKSQVYEKITCHRLGASLWLLNNARPMFDQLSCSGDYSPFHFMCYMCAFEAGSEQHKLPWRWVWNTFFFSACWHHVARELITSLKLINNPSHTIWWH